MCQQMYSCKNKITYKLFIYKSYMYKSLTVSQKMIYVNIT